MTPPDDIPLDTPPPEPERKPPAARPLRSVGPESETRGGSEAPGKTLDEAAGTPAGVASRADRELPLEPPASPPDGMPGSRAALPAGSLPKPYLGPQGDENRNPPANAPTSPGPSETVESTLPNAAATRPGRG